VIVPSTMDSPICGITISVAIIPLFRQSPGWTAGLDATCHY